MLDLAKFVDKGVQVKLTGGRQGEDNTFFFFFLIQLCQVDLASEF